jgi:hypothetical protein
LPPSSFPHEKADTQSLTAEVTFRYRSEELEETSNPEALVAGEAAYLEKAIERHSTEVAATARAGLKKLRALFPGARQVIYERRQVLGIGFAPAERGGPVFSLVLYPRWVRFFFFEGVAIDDPEGRLEGTGNQMRSIRLDEQAAILDDVYIRGLMKQALKVAGADLKRGSGQIVLKSTIDVVTTSAARRERDTRARRRGP